MPIEPGTGAYPAAFRARELADFEMIVQAILPALDDEFADDDRVRFELAKQWDFAVTEAARDAVKRRKAEQIFTALIVSMTKALTAMDTVSINGFGTLAVEGPDMFAPVKGKAAWGYYLPIKPPDVVIPEDREAALVADCWEGGAVASFKLGGKVASINETYGNFPALGSGYMQGRELLVTGDYWGVKNICVVTGIGGDGVTREFEVSKLKIVLAVRIELEQIAGGDAQVIYHLLPNQAEAVNRVLIEGSAEPCKGGADIAAARWDAQGRINSGSGARLGESGKAMAVDEWAAVADRVPAENQIKWDSYAGVPARAVLKGFPKRVRIVRSGSDVAEVKMVSVIEYRQMFANREAELRAAGVWPADRERGNFNVVRLTCRQAVIDEFNPEIISNQ